MATESCWVRPEVYCERMLHQAIDCSECLVYQEIKGVAYDFLTPLQRAQLATTRPDVIKEASRWMD